MEAHKVPHSTRPQNRPTPVAQTVILMKLCPDTLEAMPLDIAAAAAAHLDQLTRSMTKANKQEHTTMPSMPQDQATRLQLAETSAGTTNNSLETPRMVAKPPTEATTPTASRSRALHTSMSAPTPWRGR